MTSELKRALKFFLVIIAPLLLLAAFIEAFLTSSAVVGESVCQASM